MKSSIGRWTGLAAGLLLLGGGTAWAAAACCGGKSAEPKKAECAVKAADCKVGAAECKAMTACKVTAEAGKTAEVAATAEVKAQTLCPVMNAPINRKLYVDHDGQRIYVCCRGCVRKVQADPAKVVKQLTDQGIALEKVPAS